MIAFGISLLAVVISLECDRIVHRLDRIASALEKTNIHHMDSK